MAESMMMERELGAMPARARVSWAGILAGTFATISFGAILFSLGSAVGFAGLDPLRGDWTFTTGAVGGILSAAAIAIATFFGAWMGSRAAALHARRDGITQGIVTWAVAMLLTCAAFGWMTVRTTQAGAGLAGAALQGAGQALQLEPSVRPGQGADLLPPGLQQLPRQLPSGEQLQQQGARALSAVADAGAAVSWWFFATAVAAMIAGALGGLAGLPRHLRARPPMEVRRGSIATSAESRA